MVKEWKILKEKTKPIKGESWITSKEVLFLNPLTGKEKKFNLFGLKTDYGSTVLPVTEDKKVIALLEYMQGCNEVLLKLPGGVANFKGEDPSLIAERELSEETGYKGRKIIPLGRPFWREPRNSWVYTYLFIAEGCKKIKEQKCDFDEEIELKLIPFEEWTRMVFEGEIKEAAAIIATFFSIEHFKKYGYL